MRRLILFALTVLLVVGSAPAVVGAAESACEKAFRSMIWSFCVCEDDDKYTLFASAAADGYAKITVELNGKDTQSDSETVSGSTTASAYVESGGHAGTQTVKVTIGYKTPGGQSCSKTVNGNVWAPLSAQPECPHCGS